MSAQTWDLHAELDELEPEWARSIVGKRRLYLDTNYWIKLRDAQLGRPKYAHDIELLAALRAAVQQGIAVAPTSDASFLELMKQTDDNTRQATAQLMDELSGGMTLCGHQERVSLELQVWLRKASGHQVSLHDLVWTRPIFILGRFDPREHIRPGTSFRNAMSREQFQQMWLSPLTEFTAWAKPDSLKEFDDTAAKLNTEMQLHAAAATSFKKLVMDEMAGAFDLATPMLAGLLADLFGRGKNPQVNKEIQDPAFLKSLFNMLMSAFDQKPEEVGRTLPSLYIHAKCHAALRWDKNSKLKGNDLLDYQHAAAGVGYCDAFFTEAHLANMLRTKHVKLAEEFSRFVTPDTAEALDYVRGLLPSR